MLTSCNETLEGAFKKVDFEKWKKVIEMFSIRLPESAAMKVERKSLKIYIDQARIADGTEIFEVVTQCLMFRNKYRKI